MVQAQPPNDFCRDADEVKITEDGFGLGKFMGTKVDIADATREIGEICSGDLQETGNCGKTVWYRFTTATTRNVEILLAQEDSMIPQIFAGFTVYKVQDCNYTLGDLSEQLTPVAKFGASGNTCLESGEYYIQVAAKSRTSGLIWVELQVSSTSSPAYNKHITPYDFGLISNKRIWKTLEAECLDIEPYEQADIGIPDFTKSLWVRIAFNENTLEDIVKIYPNPYFQSVTYRIFAGPPDEDSLNSGKPFTVVSGNGWKTIYQRSCDEESRFTELYIQVVVPNYGRAVDFEVRSYAEVKDDWNDPSTTTFKETTKNGYDKNFDRYFDCTGKLADHICKNAIPEYFVQVYGGDLYDTLKYATYLVINSTEAGQLNLSSKNGSGQSLNLTYVLYRGDITSDCDLTEVDRVQLTNLARFCVEKETYTVVIVRSDHDIYSNIVKLRVRQESRTTNVKHYRHNNPAYIGSISSPDAKYGISAFINVHHLDTTLTADTFSWTGRFIFTYFYVEKPSDIVITLSDKYRFSVLFFKGRLWNGTGEYMNSHDYPDIGCMVFTPGYYTAVVYFDTTRYPYLSCDPPGVQLFIQERFNCDKYADNTEPELAIPVNYNLNLTFNSTRRIGIRYEYPLDFCKDCNSSTENIPVMSCKRDITILKYMENAVYYFYTFTIGENTEIEVPFYSILYRGNAVKDQNVCKDSNNIVDPCSWTTENIFCNLQPGTYTLAIAVTAGNRLHQYKLIATPHVKSPNDYAITAYDFGHLSGLQTIASPDLPMTCHTYSGPDDPQPEEQYEWVGVRFTHPVPYPDTLDAARPGQRRNLWYTFTASEAKTIQVTVNSGEFCSERIIIYRYTRDYMQDFTDLVSGGLDTSSAAMDYVGSNKNKSGTSCKENYIDFDNSGCSYNRYFIILEGVNAPNQEYKVSVRQLQLHDQGDEGNLCSTAVTGELSTYGTQTLSTFNNCHTYGGSPFENDSLDQELVSTWFRISVKDLSKFDLSIRFKGVVDINGYNIYAGTCGAMTKVMELENKYAYFTLSCMSQGDYYIQAIANAKARKGKLEFEVRVTPPLNEKCKPYDFDIPIAQFDIEGGCNRDTVTFKNISTDGNLVKYTWYINDQWVDTTRDLELRLLNPLLQDSNSVKLIVLNSASGEKDSITEIYFRDTTSYYLRIVPPPPFKCSDTVKLVTETNYPYRINYEWGPIYTFQNPYASAQQLSGISQRFIEVTATSDNCEFYDSLTLKSLPYSGLFKDTAMCGGSNRLVYDLSAYYSFYLNGELFAEKQLVIDSAGVYTFMFWYKSCWFHDTIIVEQGDSLTYTEKLDTFRLCNAEIKELKYHSPLKSYVWNTGSHDSSIMVSDSGDYMLTGSLNSCSVVEYRVHVGHDFVPERFLEDTSLCVGQYVDFVNPLPEYEMIYRDPDQDQILIDSDRKVIMALSRNNCFVYDTAEIYSITPVNYEKDTVVCVKRNAEPVWLDGGDALEYNWIGQNSNGRYLPVDEYQTYIVARVNKAQCLDTIIFNLEPDCIFGVYIPNAFTPNADNRNEKFRPVIDGHADDVTMMIFSRWGELLHESDGAEGWDGTYMGQPVQMGVYLAVIHVKSGERDLEFSRLVHVIR